MTLGRWHILDDLKRMADDPRNAVFGVETDVVRANGDIVDLSWWDVGREAWVQALVVEELTVDAATRIHAIVDAYEATLNEGAGFGCPVLVSGWHTDDPFDNPPHIENYELDCLCVGTSFQWAAYAVYTAYLKNDEPQTRGMLDLTPKQIEVLERIHIRHNAAVKEEKKRHSDTMTLLHTNHANDVALFWKRVGRHSDGITPIG